MLRHLPPTATPISLRTVTGALRPIANAKERFEAAFATYQGISACYTAASGRTVLHLLLTALKASQNKERCEVVMPAYTCPALAKVTLTVGLVPRLIDMDINTFGFDSSALANALGPRTLAVMHVHPFGIPVEIGSVLSAAERHGALLIEDAAQSMGARLCDRPVGSLGHFGLYSLGPGKPISCGGGGIVSVNRLDVDLDIEQSWLGLTDTPSSALAFLRLAAFSTAFHPTGWWLTTRAGAHNVGNHEAAQGYVMAPLSAGQATVAVEQLSRLDDINRARSENARLLLDHLHHDQGISVPGIQNTSSGLGINAHDRWRPTAAHAEPIFLRLPLLARNREQRDLLFDRLWSAGIGVGKMYRQPLDVAFPQLAVAPFPHATQIAERLLTLPTHHYLKADDIERIVDTVNSVISG